MDGQPIAAPGIAAGGPDGLPRIERVRPDLLARAGAESRSATAPAEAAPTRATRP